MSDTPQTPAPAENAATPAAAAVLPAENILKGTLFALLIIPAGVFAWGLIAAFGYISFIVGALIVFGGLGLYRYGSGGRISNAGAVRLSVIIVVTLILSFIAGIVAPNMSYFGRALSSGKFFEGLAATLNRAGGNVAIDVIAVLAFAVIGVVVAFRTAAQQRKQLPPAPTQ